ncbi:hypothetical protein GGR57DRAFT_486334 [Xylariaceae sp. FL1272]|nr:hypothetical protein GGR57DRAFT_486334 [Xylariaceae sp. FL1272]
MLLFLWLVSLRPANPSYLPNSATGEENLAVVKPVSIRVIFTMQPLARSPSPYVPIFAASTSRSPAAPFSSHFELALNCHIHH